MAANLTPHAQARSLLQRGDLGAARQIIDAALSRGMDDAELHFLHGMVHLHAHAPGLAIAAFDAALLRSPDNPAVLFNRALALHALDATQEALADFQRVTVLHPVASDAHANAGILLLRMERHAEAVSYLQQALHHAPGDWRIRRSLGNALQGMGDGEHALHILAACEQHNPEPATLTDHGMALLANARPEAARARFERALDIAPHDQTALAGLYLAANAVADHAVVDELMDHGRLLSGLTETRTLDIDALRHATLEHPSLRWEPAGRSTRHGQQSVMLDLQPGSPFADYARMIEQFTARRIAQIQADPGLSRHPWARLAPKRWRIQSWATILHEDGHQSPHIHPAGWLSGVLYVDSGDAPNRQDGSLIFGHPPPAMGLSAAPREHVHTPTTGSLMSFPSYFFHHTRPYHGNRPRISLAFDVIPLP